MAKIAVFSVFCALLSFPFLEAAAQDQMVSLSTDGQTQIELKGFSNMQEAANVINFAKIFWNAMVPAVSMPNGNNVWTVQKGGTGVYYGNPCTQSTNLDPSAQGFIIAREMAIAMLNQCGFGYANDSNGTMGEGAPLAKVNAAQRRLAKAGTSGILPYTAAGIRAAKMAQCFICAGGGTSFFGVPGNGGNSGDRDALVGVFEALADEHGNFLAFDQAINSVSVPSNDDMLSGKALMPPLAPYLSALDGGLGKICSGKYPSVCLNSVPAAFTLNASQRQELGFDQAPDGDPTDCNLCLEAYPAQQITSWLNSEAMVNPAYVNTIIRQRKNGVTTFVQGRAVRWAILDQTDSHEIFTDAYDISLGFGGVPFPPKGGAVNKPWPNLADGAYAVKVCVALPDKSGCDSAGNFVYQHFVVDTTGRTKGKAVVIANGPNFWEHKTRLYVPAGQSYFISAIMPGGEYDIGGLPTDRRANFSLTDGVVTREFLNDPELNDAPVSLNYSYWKSPDRPLLLSELDFFSGQYTGQISPGQLIRLVTKGATNGNPITNQVVGPNNLYPEAAENEYGQTMVAFSWTADYYGGRMGWMSLAPLWQVSAEEADVFVPLGIPLGEVKVFLYLNGTPSNSRTLEVVPAAASDVSVSASRRPAIAVKLPFVK